MKNTIYLLLLLFTASFTFGQSIVSVDPDTILRNECVTVNITGSGTTFTQGTPATTSLTNGIELILADSQSETSDTTVRAGITVPINARLGYWNINVKTDTLYSGIYIAENPQPAIQWQKVLGGSERESLGSIIQTSDGGYIVGGYSSSDSSGNKNENAIGQDDYWIVKLDAFGNIQWQKTIGGTSDDRMRYICQTNDDGYLLAGISQSGITGDKTENALGGGDYWVVKLDMSGNIQWQNTIGGSNVEELTSAEPTSDGGYIIGGSSDSHITHDKTEGTRGDFDYWVVKLNSIGTVQWDKTVGGDYIDKLNSTKQTIDGGYILAGFSYSNISGDKTEDRIGTGPVISPDYWVVKLDASGNIQWQNTIGGTDSDVLWSIDQTADGGFILGGSSLSDISGDKTENNIISGTGNYWIIKLDPSGNIQWQNTIGGGSDDGVRSIAQTTDGGFIVGGKSSSTSYGDKTQSSRGSNDFWVLKLNTAGSIQWQHTLGGSNLEDGNFSISETIDEGYILGGSSLSDISGDKTVANNGDQDIWIIKLNPARTLITGNVFFDLNTNCVADTNEQVLNQTLLILEPWQHYTTTDADGAYSFRADSGNYTVRLVSSLPYLNTICPQSSYYVINFPTINDTSANNNFGVEAFVFCPYMEVDISTPLLRRCMNAVYTVSYCNLGTTPADSSYLVIEMDSFLNVNSSSIPWRLPQSGNSYIFDIGNVDVQGCGTFTINVTVNCSADLGQTHCVTAHIYPDTICIAPDTSWDGSSIRVAGQCLNNDSILFRISNIGDDMQDSLRYYIVEDNVMLESKKFKLNAGLFKDIRKLASGSTLRIEADQSPGYFGRSQPSATVEACGLDTNNVYRTGFVSDLPEDDLDPFVSIDCQENIASYDPNDKIGYPNGVGTSKQITAEDDLEYRIRFQNTGTDTAFRVVIRDTLSQYLDIATIQLGSASHPYEFRIYGPRILEWTFNNILLPDSNVNEPASHGFVKFKVAQIDSNPNGTVIENHADIYFDYNAPVKTNTEFHTIGERYDFLNWSLKLQLRVFLGGQYDPGSGLMADSLRRKGFIPLQEPYSNIFTHYAEGGGETIDSSVLQISGDDAIVDWLFIQLRDKDGSTKIITTRSALIQRDGDVVDTDGSSLVTFKNLDADQYYITIRHRNHLGVMTLHSYSLNGDVDHIDFTSAPTHGSNAQQNLGGTNVMWSGEVILNGIIKYSGLDNDRDPILLKIGGIIPTNIQTGYHPEDVNNDGVVKYSGLNNDRDIILLNIGGVIPTATIEEQLPE